ncbi:SprT family zinc-dependent metalloprotease [soil metagenome]
MAKKDFKVPGVGTVSVYKRKRTQSIRLSMVRGSIRVTIPHWMPYKTARAFVESKQSWIREHTTEKQEVVAGDVIGKGHIIVVSYKTAQLKPRARVIGDTITVTLPFGLQLGEEPVQELIRDYAEQALRIQAKRILPDRLALLASTHGFEYGNLTIRKMYSRWGSCTQQKDISLNIFLMQLDDDLIDYVILHELLHTRILRHGAEFWKELEKYISDLSSFRRRMRDHQTYVIPARVLCRKSN